MADHSAELLLSLLGEPNMFLKLSIIGNKFIIENRSELSILHSQRLDKVCVIATNIRSFEVWKREIFDVDSVKRAYVDTICENYATFLNMVDTMRMNHLSGFKIYSIDSIMEFALQWYGRINYLTSLANLAANQTGFELMNIVFQEWCLQCILETGRNIYFLKEFRQQRIYEHRLEDRKRIFEEEISGDKINDQFKMASLWYDLHQRGRLYSIVIKLSQIVSEDVIYEMRHVQRVMDHIRFVQAHFFMLRSDFIDVIHNAIKDSANKISRTNLLLSSKGTSKSFIAEACLNYALSSTTLPKDFYELRQYICAERVSRPQTISKTEDLKSDINNSLTSLTLKTEVPSNRKLEDLLRLTYKPPSAIAKSVLQPMYLNDYEAIFSKLAPFRLLLDGLDEISLEFFKFSKKNFVNSIKNKEIVCFTRFINFTLFKLRRYISIKLRIIFIDFLPRECERVLIEMNGESDLHELIRVHAEFLNRICIDEYVCHINVIRKILCSICRLINLKSLEEEKCKEIQSLLELLV